MAAGALYIFPPLYSNNEVNKDKPKCLPPYMDRQAPSN